MEFGTCDVCGKHWNYVPCPCKYPKCRSCGYKDKACKCGVCLKTALTLRRGHTVCIVMEPTSVPNAAGLAVVNSCA